MMAPDFLPLVSTVGGGFVAGAFAGYALKKVACHNHSQAYCDGYNQGYRDAGSNNSNNGFQQGESTQVGIHGNNNDVSINQAQNAQSGSTSNSGYSYHGANPRCLLICAAVDH